MSCFFLIPVSIGLGLTGLCAFFWAMRHEQYEDLAGAAARILIAPDTRSHQETRRGQLAAHPDPTDPGHRL